MMQLRDLLPIAALLFAITANSLLVWLQKTRHLYGRFGKRALTYHGTVLTIVWGMFVCSLGFLVHSKLRVPALHLPLLGAFLLIVGLLLFVLAFQQIGSGGLVNANFFGAPVRKLGGIYRFCNDPMYISYSLLLLAGGFMSGIVTYVLLSVIAAIGLLGVESRIESPDSNGF